MNDATLDAEPPVRAVVRSGGSHSPLLVSARWGAQERHPIGEPDHEVGPGSGDDDDDDEDDDDDDEDEDEDVESAAQGKRIAVDASNAA